MEDKIGDKMQETIDRIVNGKWIDTLKKCKHPATALDIVISLAFETIDPEIMKFDPLFIKRLVCYLQRVYGLDLKVCKNLIIKGDEQLCGVVGGTENCNQDILAPSCERRGKDNKPERPASSHIIFSEALQDYRTCAGL